jgi:hypothetical protein
MLLFPALRATLSKRRKEKKEKKIKKKANKKVGVARLSRFLKKIQPE